MEIHSISSMEFKKYGRVLNGLRLQELLEEMEKTPVPEDVAYLPSVRELEALPVCETMEKTVYGELPVQIGYCNGHNQFLNAVEYHRSSEINVAATEFILLLGRQQDITEDFTYDTSKIEAFLLPKGAAVEIYATTLHYAPCGVDGRGFRCVVVLPRDSNLPLSAVHNREGEDILLAARNKWLIAHRESGLEGQAHIGLVGENISV